MSDLSLATPTAFPAFPFLPYEIQLELMRHLYENIETRKVTIVESPTGTGKTLSLLCATLTWLRDEQNRARRGKIAPYELDSNTDWVLAQTLKRKRRELEAEEIEYAERLAKARKKEEALKKAARARVRKRLKPTATVSDRFNAETGLDDDEFLPEDTYPSDSMNEDNNISPAVRKLMQELEKVRHTAQTDTNQPEEQEPVCTKVYYTSRTHSQLSQVLHELQKLNISLSPPSVVALSSSGTSEVTLAGHTPAGLPRSTTAGTSKRSISLVDEDDTDFENEENIRVDVRAVSLGSRKQLCVNEKLKAKVGAGGDLDEACRQRLSEKGDRRCPYLPPVDEPGRLLDIRDQILATPKDIESLVSTGSESHTCPYFGARKAIAQAQLVLLPYNLLLQKTAREALGIDLTDQVVVVDEAHNLIPTLLSLSTTTLSSRNLSTSLSQLSIYLEKFKNRLNTHNALCLRRLKGWMEALAKTGDEWKNERVTTSPDGKVNFKGGQEKVEVITSGQLMNRMGRKAEGINLLEVERYLRDSKIARKISGYCTKAMEKAAGQDPKKLAKLARLSATSPPLHVVENFIVALTAANDDGRVTITLTSDYQVEYKYQQLNPSTHFREIVEQSRAVVLAGGTMSPISDVTAQLFSWLPSSRLTTFSCGHIIPPKSLQTVVLKKGPRGGDMLFKFGQRGDEKLMTELGQLLLNLTNVVSGGSGMVVFLPSYSFLNLIVSTWQTVGILEKLKAKKKVFFEPQESGSGEVESVLREYAAEIQRSQLESQGAAGSKKGGALLFAVVGAKLSEGLNFTDDLARAVVIVGLPFANLNSPELKERMSYVRRLEERRVKDATGPSDSKEGTKAKDPGTELYENMCMNAVNQSIGRAIRHRGDWASLILVDARYGSPRIRGKLPKWIGQSVTVTETFGEAMKELGKFYKEKRVSPSSRVGSA